MVSVVEKNHQGIHMKMKYLVDPKTDNFVRYYLDNPNFFIVVCVILIYQDWAWAVASERVCVRL